MVRASINKHVESIGSSLTVHDPIVHRWISEHRCAQLVFVYFCQLLLGCMRSVAHVWSVVLHSVLCVPLCDVADWIVMA